MKSVLFTLLLITACSSGTSSHSPPVANEASTPGFLKSDQEVFAAKIVWAHPPVSQSFKNKADVHFVDKDGLPVASSRLIRFHLYMVTMGHPSLNENSSSFEEIEPGHWTVSNIYFSMGGSAGSWVVDLDAEVNGQADHIRVSVDHEVE